VLSVALPVFGCFGQNRKRSQAAGPWRKWPSRRFPQPRLSEVRDIPNDPEQVHPFMYFELTTDILCDFGIDRPDADDLPAFLSFVSGSLITERVETPMVFTTNARSAAQVPDFWGEGMPVMSRRFLMLLEQAGVDNLQTFPAVVRSDVSGEVWEGYFAVNILGMIQCADLGRSTYTEIFPGSFSFDELAIDASLAKDALLFRLKESPSTIIIHKTVGQHVMQSDPDGLLSGWDVKEIVQ
jgi:hypothetical protein